MQGDVTLAQQTERRTHRKMLSAFSIAVLLLCMVLQIAFGLIWMARSFNDVIPFGDTSEYLRLKDTMVLDEYRPVLFPLLLRELAGLEKLSGIPMNPALYLLQALLSLGSILLFSTVLFQVLQKVHGFHLRTVVRRGAIVLFSLYIFTSPLITEFNFSILTDSLATTSLLAMVTLAIACAYLGWNNWCHFAAIFLCAVMQSLLRAERFYFCIVALAAFALWTHFVQKKANPTGKRPLMRATTWKYLAVILLVAVTVPTVNAHTQTPGNYGRARTSTGGALLSRVVWGNMAACYNAFDDEVKNVFTLEQMQQIDGDFNSLGITFIPAIRAAVGDREESIYTQMAFTVLRKYPDKVLLDITDDFLCYVIVPYHVVAGLNDLTPTYTVWDYTRMANAHPLYTSYYYKFSIYAQAFLFGLAFLMMLRNRNSLLMRGIKLTMPLLISAVFIALGFSLGSGIHPNYRYMLIAHVMWLFWFLLAWSDLALERYSALLKGRPTRP